MLREIRCDKFREGHVRFSPGLNLILGDANATNSIGKSTLLMVIDFALGGETLLTFNTDIVAELGDHDYFFCFEFDEELSWFRRSTAERNVVYACDEQLEIQRALGLDEYTAFLKNAYKVDLPDLSFRAFVGLYLRVWGKDNLDIRRPLHAVPEQTERACVDTLLKAYDQYAGIRDLTNELAGLEGEFSALKNAQNREIIPKLTKRQYLQSQQKIDELKSNLEEIRTNLAQYATSLSEIVNREVLTLKQQRDDLLRKRLGIQAELQRINRNIERRGAAKRRSFEDLKKYFPAVDENRLQRVEDFHSGVARILTKELHEAKRELSLQLEDVEGALTRVESDMARTLSSVEKPEALVDHVYDVSVSLYRAKEAKEGFERFASLQTGVNSLRMRLGEEKSKVLRLVESEVNRGMRDIVTEVFGADRKSPNLSLDERRYSFEVFEDTGTGTAYASLIVFDLTVFLSTELPVIAHDSLLFKNIENDSVARLMSVYMQTDKQSFVALDEIGKYGQAAADLMRARSAIQLSSDNVLYVKTWRKKI